MDILQNWSKESILDEVIIIVLLLALVEAIGQNLLRDTKYIKFVFGLTSYIIIGYLLHYSYQKFPLSKVNVMWSCLSIIVAVILGYFLYNEKMNKNSILAIIFALLGIYFMSKQ